MKVRTLHGWDVSPEEAIALQRDLAPRVQREGEAEHVRLIAGTDISVGGEHGPGRAAVVVIRWPEMEPVEQSVVAAEVRFPYVPGLLSFREIPLLVPALEALRSAPDLLLVDGQGIAHPRRMGLAAHLGLMLDIPVIGCAKSRLTGRPVGDLGLSRGEQVPLVDRGEVVGAAVRTRAGTNPIYVSVGGRIRLEQAVEWTLRLAPKYRVPEPTRLAHLAAAGRQVAPLQESA